jgi:hypothetical protein
MLYSTSYADHDAGTLLLLVLQILSYLLPIR